MATEKLAEGIRKFAADQVDTVMLVCFMNAHTCPQVKLEDMIRNKLKAAATSN